MGSRTNLEVYLLLLILLRFFICYNRYNSNNKDVVFWSSSREKLRE